MVRKNLSSALPLLLLLVLFSACGRQYKVKGHSTVTTLDGKMLYLRTLKGGEWIAVDSAEVIHGHFNMSGVADSACMVTLYMGNENIMPLVLEDGSIEVSISNSQLMAKGTPLNDKLYEFVEKRNAMENQIDELERREARMVLEGANVDEVQAQLAKEGEALLTEMNGYVKQFIMDNYDNILGPSVFMMMCSTLPYPVMTPEIEDLMKTAPMSFKQNELVRDCLDKAKENMKLIEEHQRLQENAAVKAAQAGKR